MQMLPYEQRKRIHEFFGTVNPYRACTQWIEQHEKNGHIILWNNELNEQYIVHHSDIRSNWINDPDRIHEYRYDTLSFFSPCIFDELDSHEFLKKWIRLFQEKIAKKYPEIKKTIEKIYE